ncbi:MAG: TetR/AcrR family transcriptional regulator [Rhodococcus sp. (in: high G+C Gram-positive bacteria)]|uniref:TetR/AcrR family transcriptional regulator n=1 Tax=Rhodococcus sp. TaxID=1831 RepID=UPI003BB5707D
MTTARERSGGRRYSGLAAEDRTRARRVAIIDAALEEFGTTGFAATSVKQICTAAGLTERYFYESFRDRQACLTELYGTLVTELRAATAAAIAAADDTESAILGGLTAFVEYLTDDPRRARVILIEVVGVSPEVEELRHAVLRAFSDLIRSVWSTEQGVDVDDERTRLTAIALSGAVNNLLVDWMMSGRQQPPLVLAEVSATLFVSALAGLVRTVRPPV